MKAADARTESCRHRRGEEHPHYLGLCLSWLVCNKSHSLIRLRTAGEVEESRYLRGGGSSKLSHIESDLHVRVLHRLAQASLLSTLSDLPDLDTVGAK